MRIHKEGYKPIITVFIILLIINALFFFLIPVYRCPILSVVVAGSLIFLFFVIRFFRVPSRVINTENEAVLSPADGTIIAIEEIIENEYLKDNRLKISIFMSAHNVHVNFFPIDGVVEYVQYHPGKYLLAKLPKSSVDNEHNTVVVRKNEEKIVLFRQIAGFVARRIVCHLKKGDPAVQGEEMGMIRFGSRVDVFLPLGVEVAVKNGDKVRGQKSVLAYF